MSQHSHVYAPCLLRANDRLFYEFWHISDPADIGYFKLTESTPAEIIEALQFMAGNGGEVMVTVEADGGVTVEEWAGPRKVEPREGEEYCPYDGIAYEQVPGYKPGHGCPVCKGIGEYHLPVPIAEEYP